MCGEGGSTTWGFARAFQLAWQILHINHLSLGRTGLLTFHKLAHTTCSETRWRCQTGCRQVGPALLPHKTLSPLCSPWSAFLAHLPLPSSSAACVVSDSRRLSNWPQNVPGNRASSRGRSTATLHSEKLSLPAKWQTDKRTEREAEWKKEGTEKDSKATELKGKCDQSNSFSLQFQFRFSITTRRRREEKSIKVKLESVHRPQRRQ